MQLGKINSHVESAKYAVRGEVVTRAEQHKQALARGQQLPFDKIIHCNIGNPQELGQKPLTFMRQVMALVEYSALLDNTNIISFFPQDAIDRAKVLLKNIPSGTGAYSHSQGIEYIRKSVAGFIEKRDGIKASPSNIFLSDGASPGIQKVLQMIICNLKDGIMLPIPQYPLYSASVALFGGTQVGYYLNEENGWSLSVEELNCSLRNARSLNIDVKALVIINPGNPTGQCLSIENMREIISFVHKEKLVLLADEVYQENVYAEGKKFHSFKKVLASMGSQYSESVELFSFHSVSKGFLGECGKRGGYLEATNIHPDILGVLYKLASISLCPNVPGQFMVDLMVNPPKPGDGSYSLYVQERDSILQSLKRRAKLLSEELNKIPGFSCTELEGAMYAFPKIKIPPRAIEEANKQGKAPDLMYCLELLDNTGIVCVPGSGFGQRDGTFHFRTTILPPESQIQEVITKLSTFHTKFLTKYS
jgi:alanine transaminase